VLQIRRVSLLASDLFFDFRLNTARSMFFVDIFLSDSYCTKKCVLFFYKWLATKKEVSYCTKLNRLSLVMLTALVVPCTLERRTSLANLSLSV
jgi:hypothetical protein